LADLNGQLKKAEADDAPLENELELLKRTAIKESETMKWKALQEVIKSSRSQSLLDSP